MPQLPYSSLGVCSDLKVLVTRLQVVSTWINEHWHCNWLNATKIKAANIQQRSNGLCFNAFWSQTTSET